MSVMSDIQSLFISDNQVESFANVFLWVGIAAIFGFTSVSLLMWLGLFLWATQLKFLQRLKSVSQEPVFLTGLMWIVWLCISLCFHPSKWGNSLSEVMLQSQRVLIGMLLCAIPYTKKQYRGAFVLMCIGLVFADIKIIFALKTGLFNRSNIVQLSVLSALFIVLCWQQRSQTKQVAFYDCCALFLMIYLFFFNPERTGLVVFGLLALYFIYQQYPHLLSSAKLWVGAFLLGLLILFNTHVGMRMFVMFDEILHFHQHNNVVTSVGARLAFYGVVSDIIKQSPWWGLGLGGFVNYFPTTTVGQTMASVHMHLANPHQNFLAILADEGILGCTVFILVMASLWLIKYRDRISARVVWIAFYFGGLMNTFWYDRQMLLLLFILLAFFYKYSLAED